MKTRTFVAVELTLLSAFALLLGHAAAGGSRAPAYVWATVVGLGLAAGLEWFATPVTAHWRHAREPEPTVESYFVDERGVKRPFPSLAADPASVALSVVVPAFNEERRLPRTLEETVAALEKRRERDAGATWEVIVVDDGSRDGTADVARAFTERHSAERVRLLRLARNHGKGGAVMKGVLRARGERVLMMDADGATRFSDLAALEASLADLARAHPDGGVVCGSRYHMQLADAALKRDPLRGFVSFVFHVLNSVLVPGGVRDTQCGFKLFSRAAARRIFPRQKMWGWSFDCELLFLARDLPVAEVAVQWTDVPGSTLSVVTASLEMTRDLLLLRAMYGSGLWR